MQYGDGRVDGFLGAIYAQYGVSPVEASQRNNRQAKQRDFPGLTGMLNGLFGVGRALQGLLQQYGMDVDRVV